MADTPAPDLVERLRNPYPDARNKPDMAAAADEIERLQEALVKALHCISKHQGGCINGCWEVLSDG